jgi:hypothetical protein
MQNVVKTYLCPSDPTANAGFTGWAAVGSYAFNGMVFQADWVGYGNFPSTLQDGTSNTVLFTETYAGGTYNNSDQTLWWWDYNSFETPASSNGDCGSLNFFDGDQNTWNYAATPPTTGLSGLSGLPIITPPANTCKTLTKSWGWGGAASLCMCRAVSPHTGGINAGLGDGSVRFVSGSVSQRTWYSACTPAGGETLGSDW